jgi:hypothetical protein
VFFIGGSVSSEELLSRHAVSVASQENRVDRSACSSVDILSAVIIYRVSFVIVICVIMTFLRIVILRPSATLLSAESKQSIGEIHVGMMADLWNDFLAQRFDSLWKTADLFLLPWVQVYQRKEYIFAFGQTAKLSPKA